MNAKEYVVQLIKEYPSMLREIDRLSFEVNHFNFPPLQGLVIEAMTFSGHGATEKVSKGGRLSDKTADIAVQHVDSQQRGAYITLQTRLDRLNISVKRLQLYLTELPAIESEAIRLIYWSELSWDEIEEKTNSAKTSMLRRKSKAVTKLSKMYSLLIELGVILDNELF